MRGLISRALLHLITNRAIVGSGKLQIGNLVIQWGYSTINANGYTQPTFNPVYASAPKLFATSAYISSYVVAVCSTQPYASYANIYVRALNSATPPAGSGVYWLAIGTV